MLRCFLFMLSFNQQVAKSNKKARIEIMFNLAKFEAMLLNHNVSKQQLADYLGITLTSLYRRLQALNQLKMVDCMKQNLN